MTVGAIFEYYLAFLVFILPYFLLIAPIGSKYDFLVRSTPSNTAYDVMTVAVSTSFLIVMLFQLNRSTLEHLIPLPEYIDKSQVHAFHLFGFVS